MCMGCLSKSNHRSGGGGYKPKKTGGSAMSTGKKGGMKSSSSMYGTSNFGSPKVRMSFGSGKKY